MAWVTCLSQAGFKTYRVCNGNYPLGVVDKLEESAMPNVEVYLAKKGERLRALQRPGAQRMVSAASIARLFPIWQPIAQAWRA